MKPRLIKNSATLVWLVFACCACLVLGAMSWLTRSVIKTEQDRAQAEIRAELQERVRLSLWRIDSMGASILLEENSIPPQAFLSDPISTLPAKARFETPDGAAIDGIGDDDSLSEIAETLPSLITKPSPPKEQPNPPPATEEQPKRDDMDSLSPSNAATQQKKLPDRIRGGEEAQIATNAIESENRNRWLDQAISKQQASYSNYGQNDAVENSNVINRAKLGSQPIPSAVETNNPIGEFKPVWFEDSLFLIRKGMTTPSFAQGALIDHEKLSQILLNEAKPLLPHASLVRPNGESDDSLILASFPLLLSPGSIGITAESIPRSISITLLAGWLATLAAILTAFFLILNVMRLSERRASFVSAVTHELRTPLTTFRLYSDMLSTGAVREEKRPAYLEVLSREADRLSHLVENVLAFSQIERGSARSKVSEIEINEFLESMRERFESRLEAGGLSLRINDIESFRCTLDTSALEHILFNLIDNAAKYAADSEPPVIQLDVLRKHREIKIQVADHGPGVPASECRRIFRSFHKSAKQAAETKPGIGLGLALSKRLANTMGGSLTCEKRKDSCSGAVFILSLPCRSDPNPE